MRVCLPSYFNLNQVLQDKSFFWVGRGGHGVTHPGNRVVRAIIASKSAEYQDMPRSMRGIVAENLLANELVHIKFVIPCDAVLSKIRADDCATRTAEDKSRVGNSRKTSLLEQHGSIEQIESYPPGVCIEVGRKWALDVIKHQLREVDVKKLSSDKRTGKTRRPKTRTVSKSSRRRRTTMESGNSDSGLSKRMNALPQGIANVPVHEPDGVAPLVQMSTALTVMEGSQDSPPSAFGFPMMKKQSRCISEEEELDHVIQDSNFVPHDMGDLNPEGTVNFIVDEPAEVAPLVPRSSGWISMHRSQDPPPPLVVLPMIEGDHVIQEIDLCPYDMSDMLSDNELIDALVNTFDFSKTNSAEGSSSFSNEQIDIVPM